MSLFIFAGETSADLHGEALIEKIHAHCPEVSIFGVGGPRMRAKDLDTIMEMEKFQVMGFVDVALAFPRIMRQFYALRQMILERNPEIALFIDYPGFNLAMEKSLRKQGFKGQICHYICPSVWAWGKKRIPKMEATLDHLFTILPFESDFFDPKKLDVRFVGHPLVQRIQKPVPPLDLPQGVPIIALFPGSRAKELDRNLSVQLKVARQLKALDRNVVIAISVSTPEFKERIRSEASDLEVCLVPSEKNYSLMRQSTLAIAKSGTVTLELALHKVPTVVTYGISKLDLLIARDLLRIRLPYYCLVNIILQEEAFVELIGPNLTEEKLFEEASNLFLSEKARQSSREKCEKLHTILTNKDPAEEIAQVVKNLYREAEERSHRENR